MLSNGEEDPSMVVSSSKSDLSGGNDGNSNGLIRQWKFCRDFQRTVDEVKGDLFLRDNEGSTLDAGTKIIQEASSISEEFIG